MQLRAFVLSLRPWSFPVTVSAVLIGGAVAYRFSLSGTVSLWTLFLSLIGGLAVHSFGNIINTYNDFVYGVDRADNAADDRALVDGSVTPGEVRSIAVGCIVLTVAVMLALVSHVAAMPDALPSFGLLVLGGVSVAYAYTGWPFLLKYRCLGDVAIFIAFGPLLVEGVHFVQTGTLSLTALEFSIPVGLMTEAILHANNARDIALDLDAGARTVANTLGFGTSYRLFQAIYFVAFAALPFFAYRYASLWFLLPTPLLAQLPPIFAAFQSHDPARAKKDDGDASKLTPPAFHICDACGQLSFAFGALLSIAIVLS